MTWAFPVPMSMCRVIGPDMQYGQLDSSNLRKVITASWERFYGIPRLELKVDIKPATLAPGSAEESCAVGEDQGECFLRSFSMGENYHALDLRVTTGTHVLSATDSIVTSLQVHQEVGLLQVSQGRRSSLTLARRSGRTPGYWMPCFGTPASMSV